MSIIESILSVAAASSPGVVQIRDGRAVVDRAVWLCACVTLEEDAPIWLIFDTLDGSVGWCRMPDGSEIDELMDARLVTGDHVDPEDVLLWLQTQDGSRGQGGGWANKVVIQQVGRKIRELYAN